MKTCHHKAIYLKDYQAPHYSIDEVDLEFDLNETYTLVKSIITVHRNLNTKINEPLVLSGENLILESVMLNDTLLAPAQFAVTEESLTIFDVPDQFNLCIQTRIMPQENTALSGLYRSQGNFCTQCEAHGFRRITYFLDRPDVMARYTTTIIADEKRYPVLLSNGNLIASGKLKNRRHWVKWADPFKKPCYLFALVAGDLECLEGEFVTQANRHVAIRIYVEKGNLSKCAYAMDALKKAMRWDEVRFGRLYDLDIYMIVAVSDFNSGAMENKGLNIFNTQCIFAHPESATDMDYIHVESVIAHEYFHNWTGNRVTCRDWFQLSLKEGLTIFRDQSFTADTTSHTIGRIMDVDYLRTSQFSEDAGPLAHPVLPDSYIEINNFYTSTIYNKGAEVIRMIQTILGKKLFHKGMDLYFERHDGQAVTIEELIKPMEEVSGIDLGQFRLWYTQAGTPLLEIKDNYNKSEKTYELHIKQSCLATPNQPEKKPFHIPVKMGLLDKLGKEILTESLHVKENEMLVVFRNINEKPVPSFLRNYSAPVKLKYNYSDADLSLLMQHDTDLFNRWEAGQQYLINLMFRLIADYQQGKKLVMSDHVIEIFDSILQSMQEDKWLLAEMLLLPSERYLAELMTEIDVDAIHAVREFLMDEIGRHLKPVFMDIYTDLYDFKKPYKFNVNEVGKRYLKNVCLSYLMSTHDADIHENLGMRQFREALNHNMTDTIAALRSLLHAECPQKEIALDEFYTKWQHDPLVVDKWFALQASASFPGTIHRVKQLVHHEAFDIKNPNKVYALIGAYGHNLIQFHMKEGVGYQFLAETVLQIDALNPQVAARMLTPLTDWKRYDAGRQKLMRHQIEFLRDEKISENVYEIVTKSL